MRYCVRKTLEIHILATIYAICPINLLINLALRILTIGDSVRVMLLCNLQCEEKLSRQDMHSLQASRMVGDLNETPWNRQGEGLDRIDTELVVPLARVLELKSQTQNNGLAVEMNEKKYLNQ